MKGANVTSGYYKNPEKTGEAFDADGWFCSGDVGLIYPNGSIKIIDRSKNIFKLSQGEYIAPEKLEQIYGKLPTIGQLMIYGNSHKNCVVAIIVVEDLIVKEWGKTHNKGEDLGVLCKDPELKKFILDSMIEAAKEAKFTSLEKPGDIFLTADPFTPENNILTPTMKLKRPVCAKVYEQQIEAMYEVITIKEKEKEAAQNKA